MFPTKETIEMLRTEYPDGTRVRLVKMMLLRSWSNAIAKAVSTILTAMGLTVFDMVRSFCASAISRLPPSALASDTYTTNLKPGKQKGVPYHELRF